MVEASQMKKPRFDFKYAFMEVMHGTPRNPERICQIFWRHELVFDAIGVIAVVFFNCFFLRCDSYPDTNPCDSMLDQLFHEKNRNRSLPCVQVIC